MSCAVAGTKLEKPSTREITIMAGAGDDIVDQVEEGKSSWWCTLQLPDEDWWWQSFCTVVETTLEIICFPCLKWRQSRQPREDDEYNCISSDSEAVVDCSMQLPACRVPLSAGIWDKVKLERFKVKPRNFMTVTAKN
ncbi:hypothetical protein LINGRAHAP2_LOCUS29838 [Linum grandiflorum]